MSELERVEGQLAEHEAAIAELRETGIRLHAENGISGSDAKQWLVGHGMTEQAAAKLIVTVIRERVAAREGTASSDG